MAYMYVVGHDTVTAYPPRMSFDLELSRFLLLSGYYCIEVQLWMVKRDKKEGLKSSKMFEVEKHE